ADQTSPGRIVTSPVDITISKVSVSAGTAQPPSPRPPRPGNPRQRAKPTMATAAPAPMIRLRRPTDRWGCPDWGGTGGCWKGSYGAGLSLGAFGSGAGW